MQLSKVTIRPPATFDDPPFRDSKLGFGRWLRKDGRRSYTGYHAIVAFFVLALIVCGALAVLSSRSIYTETVPKQIVNVVPPTPTPSPSKFVPGHPGWALISSAKEPIPSSSAHPAVVAANKRVDEFLACQSKTLAQARARYSLRTQSTPPPAYDTFYDWASDHECLIDAYDQITSDFAPWYQMTRTNPKVFIERLGRAWDITAKSNKSHMQAFSVQDGKAKPVGHFDMPYKEDWIHILTLLPLPFMNLIINAQDQPRINFNARLPNSRSLAMDLNDPQRSPFMRNNRRGTEMYFGPAPQGEGHCLVRNSEEGFGDLVNNEHAFLLSAGNTGFTTDLYPILSMTKIEPCFSDIVVPSSYYYHRSDWATKFQWPNNVQWEDKANIAYWRGSTSGGYIYGSNYRSFQRFRLIDIARRNPTLYDVALTEIGWWWGCGPECDLEEISKEYDIRPNQTSMETLYGYKFAIDVDGNSFSGRFLGLMTSGSLVFKSTIFTEHFSNWLKPYEHYIPVLPDLSDLTEKIQWAIDNDDEARLIQESGKAMVERVVARDEQHDCYWFAVLLEYSRLQNMGL